MDFREKVADVIKDYYLVGKKIISDYDFIRQVCELFDIALRTDIKQSDYHFLKFLSSEIGIPQYYELLIKRKKENRVNYDLSTLYSDIINWPLITGYNSYIHRYQKQILDKFNINNTNRYFLSAPTSFGKTYVVYEIIKKMKYKNILLIFPTIALLSENQIKLHEHHDDDFWKQYNLHTLSEDTGEGDYNIWIFTPERYLSFLDNNPNCSFDFCFMDEIYKIDNQFVVDAENICENERDVAFRIALYYICQRASDILLAGPFIELPKDESASESIYRFFDKNGFKKLDFNNYEIVNKNNYSAFNKETINLENSNLKITTINKKLNLERILRAIGEDEETIVYCARKYTVESKAREIIKANIYSKSTNHNFCVFLNHLKSSFDKQWIVCKALENGIGIHHGCIPKYIQKEIIYYFNIGVLKCMFTTTTIIEGINTSAKNVIVYDYEKGQKLLKHFDAKNIAGRAGRFTYHYSGRVISLNEEFVDILRSDNNEVIKHINFDLNAPKQDADLDITSDEYLTLHEKNLKQKILDEGRDVGLSQEILGQFKAVSKKSKIEIYKKILALSTDDLNEIKKIGTRFSSSGALYLKGFDFLLKTMSDCVADKRLKFMIGKESTNGYCALTWIVNAYLESGFMGILNYNVKNGRKSYDTNVRETANLVFNTFKYQLAKYLGVFDLLLKYRVGGAELYKETTILGLVTKKLEYGYAKDIARQANDFGVPFKVLQYFETGDEDIKNKFDEYEAAIYENVINIIK